MAGPATRSPSAPETTLPGDDPCLDTVQLAQLEQAFRQWTAAASREDIRLSRQRILLFFLLIRHTGAKLNEVLALDPCRDIQGESVSIRDPDAGPHGQRQLTIAAPLGAEINALLAEAAFRSWLGRRPAIDPAFVRRKFYERAEACGFPKRWGGPEMIRRARAVELVRGNLPLPAVQQLLGHATPNQTTAHVAFSEMELQRVTRLYLERESARKTSARNAFFGKIIEIEQGDIQARVTLVNLGGFQVSTLITNESLERLGLGLGRLVTAEVKAPWVLLEGKGGTELCSADNRFQGTVVRITRGRVSSEYILRLADGTELCAVISTRTADRLHLQPGDTAHALFNCFAVTLHAD